MAQPLEKMKNKSILIVVKKSDLKTSTFPVEFSLVFYDCELTAADIVWYLFERIKSSCNTKNVYLLSDVTGEKPTLISKTRVNAWDKLEYHDSISIHENFNPQPSLNIAIKKLESPTNNTRGLSNETQLMISSSSNFYTKICYLSMADYLCGVAHIDFEVKGLDESTLKELSDSYKKYSEDCKITSRRKEIRNTLISFAVLITAFLYISALYPSLIEMFFPGFQDVLPPNRSIELAHRFSGTLLAGLTVWTFKKIFFPK